MMSARRFIIASLGLAASVLALIGSVNYFVDASHIYHADDSAEQMLIVSTVDRLRKSARGIVQPSWEERAVKWELARTSESECFVTGSSREMQFGREHLAMFGTDCSSAANLAVSGAGFEDFVTAAGLIADKPSIKAIYVGIDPWAIRFGSDTRYTQFESAYHNARQHLGLPAKGGAVHWEKLSNLINGQYLWRNLKILARGQSTVEIKEVVADQTNVADTENVFLPDGSLVYSRHYEATPPPPDGQVENGSVKIQSPYVDIHVGEEFEYILNLLHSRGARIVLVLAPYHPKVMRCESEKACAAIAAVEQWAHALADRRGYQLIGSFDARRFGLSAEHFHDVLHMDVSVIGHLIPTTSTPR